MEEFDTTRGPMKRRVEVPLTPKKNTVRSEGSDLERNFEFNMDVDMEIGQMVAGEQEHGGELNKVGVQCYTKM